MIHCGLCYNLIHVAGAKIVNEIFEPPPNTSTFFLLQKINEACPLGSYCPVAKLNKTTGICDP